MAAAPRTTLTTLLESARPSRLIAQLAGADTGLEYGVRFTYQDEDGLEVRTYRGVETAWTRGHAEQQLAAARRHQARHGVSDDAVLLVRVPGGVWGPALT